MSRLAMGERGCVWVTVNELSVPEMSVTAHVDMGVILRQAVPHNDAILSCWKYIKGRRDANFHAHSVPDLSAETSKGESCVVL